MDVHRRPDPLSIPIKAALIATAALLTGGVFLWAWWPHTAHATSVDITLSEAHGYQAVDEVGDLLILIRYGLNASTWQAHTSPTLLDDTTCDDDTDLADRCYTSLLAGVATHVLKDGSGTIVMARGVSRVGHGMSGIYMCAPGSSRCSGAAASLITFGSAAAQTCIQGPSSFSPQPEACVDIEWHSSSAVADTPPLIAAGLRTMVGNLESVSTIANKNDYLNIDLVTELGSTF
ncbi:MAG: hypothetical protein V3V35_00235, partial [Dehalococcoidia bacterium]